MGTLISNGPVVDEAVWLAWVQKGKLREQAAAKKLKFLAGIAFALLALGGAFYLGLR